MNYFSINSENNQHLGFIVFITEDEHVKKGLFSIKAQAEISIQEKYPKEWALLLSLTNQSHLHWQLNQNQIILFDESNNEMGKIEQQYMQLFQFQFLINDLTGQL